MLSWLASLSLSIQANFETVGIMSGEKAPLIPRFDAARAAPEAAACRQRCSTKKMALRLLGATAAAGILYNVVPEGNARVAHR